MARNDVTVFDEAKLAMLNGTHDFDTNSFKFALLDDTTTPTAATVSPNLSDFTEVGSAGTYTAGGTAITASLSESAGTVTLDFTTNPTWASDASNDVDAYWGLVYDTTASNAAVAFVDLGGPVDMTAGSLTVNFNAAGLLTLS